MQLYRFMTFLFYLGFVLLAGNCGNLPTGCKALSAANCETSDSEKTMCRVINSVCTEIKNCDDLTPIGKEKCDATKVFASSCIWDAAASKCGTSTVSPSPPPSTECRQLSLADCEIVDKIVGKMCREIASVCSEIKTCADLSPLGQPKCDTVAVGTDICTWDAAASSCIVDATPPPPPPPPAPPGPGYTPPIPPRPPIAKTECSQLKMLECESVTIVGKLCKKFPGGPGTPGKCKEVKTCAELTPLGETGCISAAGKSLDCEWKKTPPTGCIEIPLPPPPPPPPGSALLTDFQSKKRDFSIQETGFGTSHGETLDVFEAITDSTRQFVSANLRFFPIANRMHLTVDPKGTGTYKGKATFFPFTYTTIDIDADTMWMKLKSDSHPPTVKTTKGGFNAVDSFEYAKIIYQKSTRKLFMVIPKDATEMAKVKFDSIADFNPAMNAMDASKTAIYGALEFNEVP